MIRIMLLLGALVVLIRPVQGCQSDTTFPINDGNFVFGYSSGVKILSADYGVYFGCIVSKAQEDFRVHWADAQLGNTLRRGGSISNEVPFYFPVICEKKSEIRYGKDSLDRSKSVNIYVHPGRFGVQDCSSIGTLIPLEKVSDSDRLRNKIRSIKQMLEENPGSLPQYYQEIRSNADLSIIGSEGQRFGQVKVAFSSFIDSERATLPFDWKGSKRGYNYRLTYSFSKMESSGRGLDFRQFSFSLRDKLLQVALEVSGFKGGEITSSREFGTFDFGIDRKNEEKLANEHDIPTFLPPEMTTLKLTVLDVKFGSETVGSFPVSFYGQ